MVNIPAIDVENVSLVKKKVTILEDLSFSVDVSEVLGFFGGLEDGLEYVIPLLAGLIKPSKGRILVFGVNIAKRPKLLRSKIGIFSPAISFNLNMNLLSFISFMTELYNYNVKEADKKLKELSSILNINVEARISIKNLSFLEKQRVMLLSVLFRDPDILLLDHPEICLDASSMPYFIRYIRSLASVGKSVVWVSSNPDVIQSAADRILFLYNGHILKGGEVTPSYVEFTVGNVHIDSFTKLLTTLNLMWSFLDEQRLLVRVMNNPDMLDRFLTMAIRSGAVIENINVSTPNLTDIYLDLCRRARSDENII